MARASSGTAEPELRGPVAIVRETARSSGRVAPFLFFLGILAANLWPFAAGVALFDGVASAIFRRTHPDAASSSLLGYRLARLRQALLLVCTGYVLLLVCSVLVGIGVSPAILAVLWIVPTVAAFYPLVWIVGMRVWRPGSVLVCLLLSLFIPCAVPLVMFELLKQLRRALDNERFSVGWLRAVPRPTGS